MSYFYPLQVDMVILFFFMVNVCWRTDKTATTLREQNNVKSGYFHLYGGKECQVNVSFRYFGTKLINREIVYSIDNHTFERSIDIIIKTDGDADTSTYTESYFSISRTLKVMSSPQCKQML